MIKLNFFGFKAFLLILQGPSFGLLAILPEKVPPSIVSPAPLPPTSASSPTIARLPEEIHQNLKDPELAASNSDYSISPLALSPDIFYSWGVFCPTEDQLVSAAAVGEATGRDVERSRRIMRIWNSANGIIQLQRYLRVCETCTCDDGGDVVPINTRYPNVSEDMQCLDEEFAEDCEWYFKCNCHAQILQPPLNPGINIEEYEKAFGGVPRLIKQTFPNYQWQAPSGIGREPWTWGRFGLTPSELLHRPGYKPQKEIDDRILLPGTNEPYYLEGPGNRDKLAWIGDQFRGRSMLGLHKVKRDGIDDGSRYAPHDLDNRADWSD
ncbi:hypothetical protein TWF730_010915 [Orbilia blumenaviensis]|uniref:Uncharacterized protein n=1 Tax=Orbilia blumenaviensis TaxID=1796055 RepID=A0AAV9UJR5_9PEZI